MANVSPRFRKSMKGRRSNRKRASPVLRKTVTRIAKRVINRNLETKHVGINAVNAAFNSSISAATECYPVIPQVTPGSDGHQREGDKVRPKYLIVKGHLQYDESILGTYLPPSTVRVMILTQRNIKVGSDVQGRADVSHLLKDNIGTDVGRPYGSTALPAVPNPFDNLAPINTDLFNVLMDRKFKFLSQLYTGLGNSSDTNTKTLSGTQRTFTFYKKIKCPANLYFDDGNGNWPNNFAPFITMGSVIDDNNGQWVASTPYRLVVQSELYFTDA